MNIRFLVNNLFFSLVLCSSLLASPEPHSVPSIPLDYKQIECTITPRLRKSEHRSHPHIPGPGQRGMKITSQSTSTNWAGYAAATNLNNPALDSVSAVYGTWIVPTIKASTNSSYCAFWVGIDGFTSQTVEQIGTEHDYIRGKQRHSAWFEMFPEGGFNITGFPLTPGDVISAAVVYSGNNLFTLSITNHTRKLSFTVPSSYTTAPTETDRSSAEWIIEAPFLNSVLPLSNFVFGYLWGCFANINNVFAPINNSSWQNTAITMVTNNNTTKAKPSATLPDNGSFFMTWAHQ